MKTLKELKEIRVRKTTEYMKLNNELEHIKDVLDYLDWKIIELEIEEA